MRYKITTIVALMLLFVFSFSLVVSASVNPTIKINGQVRNYDPPAQIKDDRTMLPLRYVIEDEVFGGEVFWDELLRKVALNCQGKYIEFFIDSKKAMVDGKAKYFDTSPYIKAGRTYVPLRFLSENLGARVNWDSSSREVNINFKQVPDKKPIKKPEIEKPQVFAYYYYKAFDELKQNADVLTDVSFRWFETNATGALYYEYQDKYDEILKFTKDKGINAYASIVLMDKAALHNLLSNPQNRARLIGNILEVVKRDKYDGVDIDFEFIDPKDGPYFTLFLKELKTALGPDIPLSVAVFARTGNENWATPYEYQKIGQIVDKVIVMAYDYSYSTSQPGPVAPSWWVEQVAEYMSTNIPKDKVFLGLPTYGYDWTFGGGKATTVTAPRLKNTKQKYKLTEHFDDKSMSPYYTYYDNYGNYHQIWMENEKSLNEKLKIADKYGLGGVSFWRIGNGFNDLYNLLENK
ncbi:MAG TPA: glycosyl hydrolase family 18 protein [Syntrophomonadaceae bacterium]|nr:glycosyl hydrolase family 18 protein [Syntrophomonadaceae bacterium]